MSELHKWIASISGAVVGQIAVLAFFYLLIANPTAPILLAKSATPEPRQVTVMLSQLMDQSLEQPETIKETPEEEDPEPEEVPLAKDKAFVNTDSNTARKEAPENGRFESDRNTFASTEFLPDDNLPKEQGPTMKGEEKIPNLSLSNQEYVDGEIKPDPTPPPSTSNPTPNPSNPGEETTPVDEIKDTPPSESEETKEAENPADQLSEGEAEENKPGEADTPPEEISEKETQPDGEITEDEAKVATSTKSFVDPSDAHNAMKLPNLNGETDQEAKATTETKENDQPLAPEEKEEIKATPVEAGQSQDEIKKQQAAAEAAAIQKQLDESMFNPAFLAHHRKNNQNGDITNIGEGSVNAESTVTGKYKKAVQLAISRKWHQYRQDRAADVTWGILRVRFFVDPRGRIRNLEIVKKEATELVTEFSLKAIVDAKIPPMPPDVASQYGPLGLEMHYNIVIY